MAFNANLGSQSFIEKQIIDPTHPAVIMNMPLKADQGTLPLGSILAKDANGDVVLYNPSATDSTATPIGVLVEDVDTASSTVGAVLKHGTVVKKALLAGGSQAQEADIEKLEAIGIFAI